MRTSEPRPRALGGLTPDEREALRRVAAAARFELIPLPSALEVAEELPPGAPVTVTASPSRGIDATLELAAALAERGRPATPHLSARLIRGRAHLAEVLARCREAGLQEAFVVGGDGDGPGGFADGLALLRGIHDLGSPFERIGVPGYPEGHPGIPEPGLREALRAKAPLAHWVTSQMCFDPPALAGWIAELRASGIPLAVHLGVPGVTDLAKLLAVGARIGLASSVRYLRKNRSLLGRIARGRFGPDGLLEALGPTLADPAAGVSALHVFTFNRVGPTVAWQRALLAQLADPPEG